MTATIHALATPAGRGAVAILRVSGPAAGAVLTGLTGRRLPPPRLATRSRLRSPSTGEELDDALVLWFPGPASFTGEDVAELHIHGGRAVIAGLVEALSAFPTVRPAEAGEFTRRAFDNGKLDLTRAEAIADLVDAETAAQRRQALRQMEGGFGRRCDDWRDRLLRASALAEADIDFSDEDIPDGLSIEAARTVGLVAEEIARLLIDGRRGEKLRDGFSVVLLGAPNAGKSSLLNALAGRDAAIVSARAGTTRDVIEVRLDLGGRPVILADTAGLRETNDEVEEEGVRRARARAARADARLLVFDAALPPDPATSAMANGLSLILINKIDLASPPAFDGPSLSVSARTGVGLDALEAWLVAAADEVVGRGEDEAVTRERHRLALEETREHLERALSAPSPELAAEDLRLAVRALGRITGRVDVEDLLDLIFREFCIGK